MAVISVSQARLDTAKVTVETKYGEVFANKDVTDAPFGSEERYIGFWEDENTVKVFPLSEVRSITFHF